MDADVKWCDIDLFSDELCSCIASRFISLISCAFFVETFFLRLQIYHQGNWSHSWFPAAINYLLMMITLSTLNVMNLRSNVERSRQLWWWWFQEGNWWEGARRWRGLGPPAHDLLRINTHHQMHQRATYNQKCKSAHNAAQCNAHWTHPTKS